MATPTGAAIRVLIVDDDPLVRDVLTRYFHTTTDIQVAGTATNGVDALTQLDSASGDVDPGVDLVLSDVYMPKMDGATLLRELNARPRPPAFLAITSLENDRAMLDILTQGARGYILKSQPPEEIILGVRHAAAGGTAVSPAAMTNLVHYLSPAPAQHSDKHPDQYPEGVDGPGRAVLELLCQGLSNAEIAQRMNYSESTVKKHVSHLLAAYQVRSRLDLVVTVLNRKMGDK